MEGDASLLIFEGSKGSWRAMLIERAKGSDEESRLEVEDCKGDFG